MRCYCIRKEFWIRKNFKILALTPGKCTRVIILDVGVSIKNSAQVLHESELEPLRKVLTSYDIRNHGQSISGEVYARIARKNPPEVDSFGLLLYGERPRNLRESTDLNLTGPRKGSAGKARSHFPQDFYQEIGLEYFMNL